MKVMVIVGTRPEAIKMAPVIKALREADINTLVCATGQHREMLAQALEVFSIKPEISLDVMSPGQSLNVLSARLLMELDHVLAQERPEWVLVQGDTTSALCGGLAAFHRGIKIGHVEAGLRTGDLSSPFPEEANRSLLARIVNRHFSPTNATRQTLLDENVPSERIDVTGNTVVDAVQMALQLLTDKPMSNDLKALLEQANEKPFILITCHRRENFGGPLEEICHLLKRLSMRYPNYQWVFPVHLNPNVQEPVQRILAGLPNLSLLSPVNYLTSLRLIARSALVVSDSGGIQEEAPSFSVPVVVMRSHTERAEGIKAGFATLAGQSAENIEAAVSDWLDHTERRESLRSRPNPYGDGNAAKRIVERLTGHTPKSFHG